MNSKIIIDTHAAIDRLVAHLERQATEHVHALDALRAEVEALRTQNAHLRNQLAETHNGLGGIDHLTQRVAEVEAENAHLRALQAATEPKPVREIDRNPDKVARTTIAGLPALSEDKDGRRRHAVKHARGYVLYDEDDRIVACEATDDVALGWCQFGWPYGAKPTEPKVVTGRVNGYLNMSEPGSDPNRFAVEQNVRQATKYDEKGWALHDVDGSSAYERATLSEAITWVLDGVLPTR